MPDNYLYCGYCVQTVSLYLPTYNTLYSTFINCNGWRDSLKESINITISVMKR